MWNIEWKKLKRKCDKNLNILAQEEYFEKIARRSASHNFTIKYCNEEQQFVYEDHDTDSNNECYAGMSLNIIIILASLIL